jgi:hypothetical protein
MLMKVSVPKWPIRLIRIRTFQDHRSRSQNNVQTLHYSRLIRVPPVHSTDSAGDELSQDVDRIDALTEISLGFVTIILQYCFEPSLLQTGEFLNELMENIGSNICALSLI